MSKHDIPEVAVEAAAREWQRAEEIGYSAWWSAMNILEAALPHILAAKVAEVKANNDHIIEGGDGYSAGFHYALHCIEGEA